MSRNSKRRELTFSSGSLPCHDRKLLSLSWSDAFNRLDEVTPGYSIHHKLNGKKILNYPYIWLLQVNNGANYRYSCSEQSNVFRTWQPQHTLCFFNFFSWSCFCMSNFISLIWSLLTRLNNMWFLYKNRYLLIVQTYFEKNLLLDNVCSKMWWINN